MIEKSGTEIADVPLPPVSESLQDRGRVVEGLDQFNFGNGKFFAGFEKNIPGNAGIFKTLGQSFRYFLASAV
jgi:hypothetical protein